MYDHQLSPRLGQRVPAEHVPLRKVGSDANRPEAPHDGTTVYRTDTNVIEIYDDASDTWDVVGAIPAPPTNLTITGEIKMWLAGAVPSGYLLLNGTDVSRTGFASLFALWGTTYGVGDGSTTFTLPDMRSRMPIGAGTFAALGTRDGLTEANRSLQHTHNAGTLGTASTGAHSHSIPAQGTSATNASGTGGGFSPQEVNYENHAHGGNTGSNGAHSHTVTGATANSGATALPYFAVNYIVKT